MVTRKDSSGATTSAPASRSQWWMSDAAEPEMSRGQSRRVSNAAAAIPRRAWAGRRSKKRVHGWCGMPPFGGATDDEQVAVLPDRGRGILRGQRADGPELCEGCGDRLCDSPGVATAGVIDDDGLHDGSPPAEAAAASALSVARDGSAAWRTSRTEALARRRQGSGYGRSRTTRERTAAPRLPARATNTATITASFRPHGRPSTRCPLRAEGPVSERHSGCSTALRSRWRSGRGALLAGWLLDRPGAIARHELPGSHLVAHRRQAPGHELEIIEDHLADLMEG